VSFEPDSAGDSQRVPGQALRAGAAGPVGGLHRIFAGAHQGIISSKHGGVYPVFGSSVTSPTVKIPNCMPDKTSSRPDNVTPRSYNGDTSEPNAHAVREGPVREKRYVWPAARGE
jgi:hypothetical protein